MAEFIGLFFGRVSPPMKCTRESGGCGPRVAETSEAFQ